jgi:hypothetical protein
VGLFAQILVCPGVPRSSVSVLRIHSGTFETCGLNCGAVNITCAKKTEKALLDYIHSVDADAETPVPRRDSNIELSRPNKRRRRGNSYERTGSDNDRGNGDLAEGSVADDGDSVEGSVTDDGDSVEGSVTDDGDSAEGSVADDGEPAERDVADDGGPAVGSVADDGEPAERDVADDGGPAVGTATYEKKKGKAVRLLTNKIRNGIKEREKEETKAKKKRPAVWAEITLYNTTTNQPENPPATHTTFFELITAQSTQSIPMGDLIKRIWEKANELLRAAGDMSWKYLFICSCLRILYGIKDEDKAVTRWLNIVRMANSIVDGLWEHWGPLALFVYEVLAGKANSPRQRQLLTHK